MKLFSILSVVLFLLSGCSGLTPWQYAAQSNKDPEIAFGDRPEVAGNNYAKRYFAINVKDAASLTCARYKDFSEIGTVGGFYATDPPKTIRVPEGKAIAIYSSWGDGGVTTCEPPVAMFTPKSGEKYSVEIRANSGRCSLSIVNMNISNKGERAEVTERTKLADCK